MDDDGVVFDPLGESASPSVVAAFDGDDDEGDDGDDDTCCCDDDWIAST